MEEPRLAALKALETMTMTTKLREGAPQSDYELMRILREGEAEDNLDKIYQYVRACEMGPGLANSPVLTELIKKGFEQSPERVMKIIAGKRHLERCVCLASCSDLMRIAFIKMGADENMCFLYECLRQLISYGRMTVDKIAAIVSGTVMLSEGSEELWRCLIMTKEYDKKWITLLGQILPELGVEALIVYADTIKIDMSPEYGGLISHALGQIKPENVKKLQQAAGSVVYRRWKNYLNQVKDKKSGLHGIFISAYGELICGAVRHIYGEQEMWDQELSEEILQLERDMEGWYSDVMQMKTVFFVHMSQLCLLLCAAAELGLQPGKRCKEMIHRAKRLMEMQEYLWKDENQRVKLYGMLDKFSEMRC